ncbi:MAG: DMT family transporter [Spirochaetaceae bacterium]|nr:MAG: DMT family transporter [Spirochaetaceae bacterium]
MPAKTKALLMNLGAVLCWAFVPLAIRFVSSYYTVLFQSLFRYATALIVLWSFTVVSVGTGRLRSELPQLLALWPKILLIALANFGFQFTFTLSIYLLYPGLATLVNQSLILFSVFLAALMFPDERSTLKSALFVVGVVAAIAGVVMTIVGSSSFGTVRFSMGIVVVLVSALFWALLGALIRKWISGVSTTFALSSVFTIVTLLFLAAYVIAYRGFPVPRAPSGVWLFLAVSGLIGLGIGHSLYYRSVGILGLALSSSLALLIPLLVGMASFFLFRERLTWIQLVGGACLLSGCYLVIRARFRHIE